MNEKNQFAQFKATTGDRVDLQETGTWQKSVHLFDEPSILAVRCALATRRPLLILGEPGIGKSQLPRAVAARMGWHFLSHVVHARSESQDLLWDFDAVGRLASAHATREINHPCLAPSRYVRPGVLWWAFDRNSALAQKQWADKAALCCPTSVAQDGNSDFNQGSVVLIDEIDKADIDLPNGLLEALGNGSFPHPYYDEALAGALEEQAGGQKEGSAIQATIGLSHQAPCPLIVITSNEEHVLPDAFERRCVVLRLSLPKDEKQKKNRLHTLATAHFWDADVRKVRLDAASDQWCEGIDEPGFKALVDCVIGQFNHDVSNAEKARRRVPSVAEFIDTIRVVLSLQAYDKKLSVEDRLKLVQPYVLGKYTQFMEDA